MTVVFFACPGLGHINRGFETFTRECFDVVRRDPRLDAYLFKGAGAAADHELALPCLRRTGMAAQWLARLAHSPSHFDPYYFEQLSFALALLPHIRRRRPDVILFSDGVLGSMLWRWRRLTRGRFKLLLSNGGPLGPPAFPRFDHVHQVSRVYYEDSALAGRSPSSQTLLPYGFALSREFHPVTPTEKAGLHARLGLPMAGSIILSVGALNCSHKRMDYLAREVASLPEPRPFLVLLGNSEAETPLLSTTVADLLGSSGSRMTSVPREKVTDYYRAADIFALASLKEGFGRVYVEAFAQGLPCLAHAGRVQREVLGDQGHYADATQTGAFAREIAKILASPSPDPYVQHAEVYNRLSWDALGSKYVEMIERCAIGG